jgi:hypothetical protein
VIFVGFVTRQANDEVYISRDVVPSECYGKKLPLDYSERNEAYNLEDTTQSPPPQCIFIENHAVSEIELA